MNNGALLQVQMLIYAGKGVLALLGWGFCVLVGPDDFSGGLLQNIAIYSDKIAPLFAVITGFYFGRAHGTWEAWKEMADD